MKNLNDLNPEEEYHYLTLSKEEVIHLNECYKTYLSNEFDQICAFYQSSLDKVQALYNRNLGKEIEYYWYLQNYIEGFDDDEKRNSGPTEYGLELPFEDAEQLAKVIFQIDRELKLKSLIENVEPIAYFYQNLKAAKGAA